MKLTISAGRGDGRHRWSFLKAGCRSANVILIFLCDSSLRRDESRGYVSNIGTPFIREPAMTTDSRDIQMESIRTTEQLRTWLATNRVHGLSAGRSDVRWIEATSLVDGRPTSLEVPTDLFRALDAEMVWMHEVDTLPDGILLALRSQLENAPSAF
jgi:hypothetical protein